MHKFAHIPKPLIRPEPVLNSTALPWRLSAVAINDWTIIESEILIQGKRRRLAAFRDAADAEYAVKCVRCISEIHEALVDGRFSHVALLMESFGFGEYEFEGRVRPQAG
jgi:hypothetical protein